MSVRSISYFTTVFLSSLASLASSTSCSTFDSLAGATFDLTDVSRYQSS